MTGASMASVTTASVRSRASRRAITSSCTQRRGSSAGSTSGWSCHCRLRTRTTWDWTGRCRGDDLPGSWGGHAVDVVRYDAAGLTIVTWGRLKGMTWSFWDRYCDEAYCILSRDFLDGGRAPNGFDLDALRADLQLVTA